MLRVSVCAQPAARPMEQGAALLWDLLACLPKTLPAAVTICLMVQVIMAAEQRQVVDCVQIREVFLSWPCLRLSQAVVAGLHGWWWQGRHLAGSEDAC